MNNAQIIDTVVEKAIQYEKDYHGCAQCVVAAVMDVFDIDAPAAFRATTGFSGGMGCTGRTCGALSGGIISIGLIVGRDRDNMKDPKRLRWENFALVKDLIERYEASYDTLECRKVQERVVGIGVDFHGRVHKPMAKVLLKELEQFDLMFVEEPVLSWLHAPGTDFDRAIVSGIDIGVPAVWELDAVVEAARATVKENNA